MTWAQDASDALEALGDSPTPDQARTITDRYPNVDVLAAVASRGGGGGGGFDPVSCVLQATGLDVQTEAEHPVLWDELVDNTWDFNQIGAIPAGLGLDFEFDGSASVITMTTAGTWSFTYNVTTQADATFEGYIRDSMAVEAVLLPAASGLGRKAHMAAVYKLPSDAAIDPRIETETAGTIAVVATVTLVIVRLA